MVIQQTIVNRVCIPILYSLYLTNESTVSILYKKDKIIIETIITIENRQNSTHLTASVTVTPLAICI